ncbi:alcohol dehydrogenase [Zeugodacus cucurbitae]|uniref:alcohol dehydrogenase n=1 Tax=Zeugodacus cucurbitae TaxID=28588 RepID=A0A0A1X494_ZEUCU|nr:alcohol dehydrogenase [Zeugodacus cucurbitae]
MDLKNKNVIYVGGFGGIGFCCCKTLLEQGVANVGIMDVVEDPEMLETLQAVNKAANVFYIKMDLTDMVNIEGAFTEAHDTMGRFDIVVNGSGIMNEHEIERTIQINLIGVIYSTFAALRLMDKSKGGNGGLIVNISSIVSLDAYGAYAVYTASKYGVNGFTRALSDPYYYSQTKVSFITICPSTTETAMIASLRMDALTTFDRMPPLPKTLCNNQSPENCAYNLVTAIKTAKNGSVWILSAGILREYHYPDI